jgi:hypothetical protein
MFQVLHSEVSLADREVLVQSTHLGFVIIVLMSHHGLMTTDVMADGSGSSGISLDCRSVVTRPINGFMTIDTITPVYTHTLISFKHHP